MAISKLILNGETQMDVTSNTNTSNNMLSGVVGTKNDGTSVTGNIASKSSTDLTVSGATVTAPAGYYANTASKAVATTTHPNPSASIASATGVVTTSHTQDTGYVTGGTTTGTLNLTTQAGKTVTPTESAQTAVASYRWTTGDVNVAAISSTYVGTGISQRSAVDITQNSNEITAPMGYYSQSTTYTVPTYSHTSPSIAFTSSTGKIKATHNATDAMQNWGMLTGYTTTSSEYTLTTQATQEFYPSTADQTIASYRWLTGAQTIKGVTTSNLTAENIAEGVVVKVGDSANASRITQITGTHSGGSTHTLTLTGSGSQSYCYIKYKDIKYYNTTNIQFHSGETITLYCRAASDTTISVKINQTIIKDHSAGSYEQEYTLPDCDVSIDIAYSTHTYLYLNSVGLDITENGIYEVGGYGYADVNVEPTYTITITSTASYYRCIIYKGVHYYTAGQSFQISAGETIELYNSNSTRFLYINGENVLMPENSYIYTPSGDINADLNKAAYTINIYESIIPTGSMPITSNASYNVYGYSTVDVDIDVDVVAPYYNAYRHIALKSGINSSNTDIVSYFSTISSIIPYQFEDICMSGSFTFPVCTTIGDGGFQHTGYNHCLFCTFDFPEVVSIGIFAFKLQSRLTSINAPKATEIKTQVFMSCTSLQTVNFPQVTSIGDSAFFDCRALTTVSFPEALYMYTSAFNGCQNLSSISFPKISQIGMYAFARCYSLTTADFPSTTSIGAYAFQSCSNLTTANFPSATSIGQLAFYQCSNLSSISFPNTTYIGSSTFYGCIKLIEASFPKLSEIELYAFGNCSSLTTANFASATLVSNGGFNNCINLTTISFPELLTIQSSAFGNCSALTTVDFPKVTVVSISAFRGCTNLTTASFPNAVSIATSAFYSCYHLLSLYLLGSSVVSLAGTGAFLYTPISTYTTSTGGVYGSIFVPASLYNSYITATNWSIYSSRIVSV